MNSDYGLPDRVSSRTVDTARLRTHFLEGGPSDGVAVLFRYGWAQLWSTPAEYNAARLPGIGLEVARWLVERKVTVTGGDTSTNEVSPSPSGLVIPVHQELMMKNGIFNIENLTFEELAAHATQERFVYYHRWRVGDVLIWDERATMHRGAGDYRPDERRVMLRTIVYPN